MSSSRPPSSAPHSHDCHHEPTQSARDLLSAPQARHSIARHVSAGKDKKPLSESRQGRHNFFRLILTLLLLVIPLLGQPRPRIDFDHLLGVFPNLPWDFEIRYVTHDGPSTDMLRLYYDGRADLVRWRPDDPGSLAEVCHGNIDDRQFRQLLELFRDKKFNDLPSDNETFRTIAEHDDATVSVRVGKTTVRKFDRHERDNPGLLAIETELDSIQKLISADPKTKCGMESVPARP